jgi:hypothetical protein
VIDFRRVGICIVASVLLSISFQDLLSADVADEDEIKAAYLYHILHFVSWPPAPNKSSTKPINICVLGKGDNNQTLQKLASKSISNRPINVQFLTQQSQHFNCHLLYSRDTPYNLVSHLLPPPGKNPVLIVGDSPGFAKQGGMIGFVRREGSVRIEINLGSIKKAGLAVSANLLEVAIEIFDMSEEES